MLHVARSIGSETRCREGRGHDVGFVTAFRESRVHIRAEADECAHDLRVVRLYYDGAERR